MNDSDVRPRCEWAAGDPLMRKYHDTEWGVPQRDDRMLWEMLMLEGFQAGLAWITVLRKREAFRKAFSKFEPAKVARYAEKDVRRLMANAGIIRARAKIEATIRGARIYCEMQERVRVSATTAGHSQRANRWWVTDASGWPALRFPSASQRI